MNEAKEEWMPEIYCLGASTPYAYTWPDVEARRGRKDWAPSKEKENLDGGDGEEEEGREREPKWKIGGRVQVAKLKHSLPLSPFVRRTMARGESVRDRKLVKSGGQCVELSVALSVAGFIRSEGGIYVGPSVIYRFRWYTRYRYTDIDTSLVRARQSRLPLSVLSLSFFLFLFVYILLYYWISLSLTSLSLFLYLLGETWFTWGHLQGRSGKHDIFDRESETPEPPE